MIQIRSSFSKMVLILKKEVPLLQRERREPVKQDQGTHTPQGSEKDGAMTSRVSRQPLFLIDECRGVLNGCGFWRRYSKRTFQWPAKSEKRSK